MIDDKQTLPVVAAPDAGGSSSKPLTLIVAWLWAGLPLAWGITQTVHKALALFQ